MYSSLHIISSTAEYIIYGRIYPPLQSISYTSEYIFHYSIYLHNRIYFFCRIWCPPWRIYLPLQTKETIFPTAEHILHCRIYHPLQNYHPLRNIYPTAKYRVYPRLQNTKIQRISSTAEYNLFRRIYPTLQKCSTTEYIQHCRNP